MRILGYNIELRKARDKEPVESFLNVRRMSGAGRKSAMSLAAVYRCVNVISDSVAQLPLDVYMKDKEGYKKHYINHCAYTLLREFPSPDMTRFTFIKTLVNSVLLDGNGYAYIDRDNFGNALSLQFLPPSLVNIVYISVEGISRLRYQVTGFQYLVEPSDMIHVLNFSYDGVKGISTLSHARQTLGISTASEDYARNFFAEGGSVRGIITTEGRVNDDQRQDIKKSWADIVANGGVGVMGGNMKYEPITIKPLDAQMIETRAFNVVDICRFFGVSPVKCFDLSKSSYSTVEATQIGFLTDTLAPLLENMELEFKRKVFRPSERPYVEVQFDVSNLLRADKAAQSAWMKTQFDMGGLTPNEARRVNNLPKIENGDIPLIRGEMVPLDYAVSKTHEGKM